MTSGMEWLKRLYREFITYPKRVRIAVASGMEWLKRLYREFIPYPKRVRIAVASGMEWLKRLYREFITYPKRVRIAVAIGAAVVIIIFLLVPGQTAFAAVIAFGATFSGVFLSFLVERRRREAEERSQFSHMVQGVLVESATNHATLNSLKKWVRPGKTFTGELSTDTLRAALNDPLFHRWADHSLVYAVQVVRMHSDIINNVLSMHQEAAVDGHGMTDHHVNDLLIRAEIVRDIICVTQELLEQTLHKFGAPILADSRMTEIDQRLADIARRGADRLESGGGGNAEERR